MIRVNVNNFRQVKPCVNITPEVDISPPLGSPEYDEWKKKDDIMWAEYRKEQEENKLLEENEKEKVDIKDET